jgi:hypothetical protein
MQPLQFTLTVDEVNQILDVLGDRPYKQVFELIIKLQQQAEAQLQARAAAQQDPAHHAPQGRE